MIHFKKFYPLLISLSLILLSYSCEKKDSEVNAVTITDVDGNVYNTVTIGSQVWMKENLKTTKYNDGTPIQLITDDDEWIKIYREEDKDAYCWYENDKSTYGNTYGALYNWYAVESDNICPAGWHLPTYDDWSTLIDYLGGLSVGGGKLKEKGTGRWMDPNTGATNEVEFTALPAGSHPNIIGNFHDLGTYASWWSQPKPGRIDPESVDLSFNNTSVSRGTTSSTYGHSVKCIKD